MTLYVTYTNVIKPGPIEKGANDGQLQYQKDITAALKAAVAAKSQLKAGGAKGRGAKGGKRKKGDLLDGAAVNTENSSRSLNAAQKAKEPDWGVFEILRGPLGPVAGLVSAPTLVLGLLFLVLFMYWRGSGVSGARGLEMGKLQRGIAYEEVWRREESELWKWLEERAGLEGAVPGFLKGEGEEARRVRRVRELKGVLGGTEMGERGVREAIRVTRERLEALEEAVGLGGGDAGVGDGKAERRGTV